MGRVKLGFSVRTLGKFVSLFALLLLFIQD